MLTSDQLYGTPKPNVVVLPRIRVSTGVISEAEKRLRLEELRRGRDLTDAQDPRYKDYKAIAERQLRDGLI